MSTATIDRESRLRSVLGALSDRVLGTVLTVLIAWQVTGDARAALVIGGIEPMARTLLYYFHERAWQRVPRGRVRRLPCSR